MRLGDAAKVVAGQAMLFEEFVVREAAAGRFDVAFAPSRSRSSSTATATRRRSARPTPCSRRCVSSPALRPS